MIPLCLVTGFLGSGKTTFLRHTVRRYSGRRVVYLINEFSPSDIDGGLLSVEGVETVSISGGSIFCRCLIAEFISRLKTLPEQFTGIDGVVVETSGIADPRVARQMLAETGLDQLYNLSRIVSIVDPISFRKLLHTLPNIQAQVEAADTVVLNKIDISSESEIASTLAHLRRLRPGVEVLQSSFCVVDVELFAEQSGCDTGGEYARCRDPNYTSIELSFCGSVDIEALTEAFTALKDDLYRAKGIVPTDGNRVMLQATVAGVTAGRADRGIDSGFICIVRDSAVAGIVEKLALVRNVNCIVI